MSDIKSAAGTMGAELKASEEGKSMKRRFSGHEKPRPPVDLTFDFKDVDLLRRYMNEHARMVPARISRLSAKQQRELAQAIKRARHLGMLPIAPTHGFWQ